MSLPHDLTFKYGNDDFSLVKAKDSAHPITIKGVTYDVKGNAGKLEEVYQLLRSASLDSVVSEADLKTRLSSVKGISIPSAKATHEVGKKHVAPAKTTDDIKERRPIRPRALSTVVTNRPTEKEEIAKKSGELWECVGRKPDRGSNGYLYRFKLKEGYDSVTPSQDTDQRLSSAIAKIAEIFPAIEPTGLDISYLDPKVSEEAAVLNLLTSQDSIIETQSNGSGFVRQTLMEEVKKKAKSQYLERDFLWELGYKVEQKKDGVYLTLPDRETLLARWEKLREKMPQLPTLDIVSSEGIASDMAFIEAYFQHDVLLSEGKEFIHDHTAHVLSTISIIRDLSLQSDDQEYAKEKWRLVKVALAAYRKLMIVQKEVNDETLGITENQIAPLKEHLDKIALGLGVFVDNVTAAPDRQMLAMASARQLDTIYKLLSTIPQWGNYLKNRFGEGNEGIAKLGELWDQINTIEKEFDAQRKKDKL